LNNNIEFISFCGSANKLYTHIGFIQYLETINFNYKNIKGISGSSSGSIIALMFNLGFKSNEIIDIIGASKYNFLNKRNMFFSIYNLIKHYGIVDSSYIKKYCDSVFEKKMLNPNITFEELYKITNIELVISGSNINKMRIEYFTHKTTPNMKIFDAIKISIAFPLVFKPVKYNDSYYSDGGLYDNLPLDYFDNNYDKKYTINSVALLSNNDNTLSDNNIKTNNFSEFIYALLYSTWFNGTYKTLLIDNNIDPRVIIVPISDKTTSQFSVLTQDEINELIKSGFDATFKYFENKNKLDIII
jgi:predicted acylesterase/phospholipase RssA